MSGGFLASINVSGGGVPKHPQQSAAVRTTGLEGDAQRDLRYHGGPDRAVSLYSGDLIDVLLGEGHPIRPGSAGENLTIRGIDWTTMVGGARVTVGEVMLELTKPAAPYRNIAASFQDGSFDRISHRTHPGWSRMYARVIREGTVNVGDPVVVISDSRDELKLTQPAEGA